MIDFLIALFISVIVIWCLAKSCQQEIPLYDDDTNDFRY
jgi:hypothetical protein